MNWRRWIRQLLGLHRDGEVFVLYGLTLKESLSAFDDVAGSPMALACAPLFQAGPTMELASDEEGRDRE